MFDPSDQMQCFSSHCASVRQSAPDYLQVLQTLELLITVTGESLQKGTNIVH